MNAAEDWRPIATAPTWKWEGGRNIALGNAEIMVGWAGSRHVAMAYWHPRHEKDGGGGRWEIVGSGYGPEPTHWKPILEPPK